MFVDGLAWHFAADRVADEKLMERGFLNLWDNRNALNSRAFRKKVDDHAGQRLVDTSENEWSVESTRQEKRTRAQWEGEWLDEQHPDKQVSILHISNLSSMATENLSGTPEESGKNPGDEVQQAAGSCRPWNRGSSEGNIPWISLCGNVSNHSSGPRQGHKQNRRKEPALSRHADSAGRHQNCESTEDLWTWHSLDEKPTSELTVDYMSTRG